MSYSRFGKNSDVYMFPHISGFIECCNCVLTGRYYTPKELKRINKKLSYDFNNICFKKTDRESLKFNTSKEALDHLYEHKKAGHKIDIGAIKRLKEEIKKNDR